MLKLLHRNIAFLTGLPLAALLSACAGEADSPGLEYMPDMYRGPAVEAYVDAGQDPYYFGDSLARVQRNTPGWRTPPPGTIAFSADPAKATYNMPYALSNTPEGYEASAVITSPVAMTEATVEAGKVMYGKFCVHCHGETGMGDGSVVNNGGHPPPTAYSGPLKDLPEGRMFHTLTYGKGMMGSHASQLDKEERWTVIQYVKYLQNGGSMSRTTAPAMAGGVAPATTPTAAVN